MRPASPSLSSALTASPSRPGGSQPAGSRTTTATCSTTVAEVLHAVPYTLSGDTSIRATRFPSDRSRRYEPAGALPKKPGRRASTLPVFMWSMLSPVLTESPRLSEMAPQSSFSTATEYPGCRNSAATSVVFPAPELPVITTPRRSVLDPTDNTHPCTNTMSSLLTAEQMSRTQSLASRYEPNLKTSIIFRSRDHHRASSHLLYSP